jgi:hypothetical protein
MNNSAVIGDVRSRVLAARHAGASIE